MDQELYSIQQANDVICTWPASGHPADALHMQRVAGGRCGHHIESMTSVGQLCQSMHIYLKNNPAKFHPDPI